MSMTAQIWTNILIFGIGQFVVLLIAMIRIWLSVSTEIAKLNVRVDTSEKRQEKLERNDEQILDKLDKVLQAVHGVELKVANKKDRDN